MTEDEVDGYFEDEAIQDQILVGRHVGWLQLAILAILVQLERDVTAALLRFNPSMSKWRKRDIAAAISSTNKIVSAAYADIAAGVDLVGVASIVAEKVAREVVVAEKAFGNVVVPPTQEVIDSIAKKAANEAMVMNAHVQAWWDKQAADTAFRLEQVIRQGVSAGADVAAVVTDIRQTVTVVAERNAGVVVQGAVSAAVTAARLATYADSSTVVLGVRQISVLDGVTSMECRMYSGATWDLSGNPILGCKLPYNGGTPRHGNCRSMIVAISKLFAAAGQTDGASKVNGTLTFIEWLDSQSPAKLEELFGPATAKSWLDGNLTVRQLLNGRANPLTLEELRASMLTP